MSDIFKSVTKFLGLAFAAVVIAYTSILTFQLAGRLLPGNTIGQAMTVMLFDGGALIWFLLFINEAKGTLQWAMSAIGFLVGLAGAVIMAAGELILGQALVVIDDPSTLGWGLIATVIVAALVHASLTYFFHFVNPDVIGRIENSQQVAKAIEAAYKDARGEIARNTDDLVQSLKASVIFEAEQQIARQTAVHIRSAKKSSVIDVVAHDVPVPQVGQGAVAESAGVVAEQAAAAPQVQRVTLADHSSGEWVNAEKFLSAVLAGLEDQKRATDAINARIAEIEAQRAGAGAVADASNFTNPGETPG